MNPGKRGHEGIKEAPLSWLQSLNQRQSKWRAGGSEGVLSYLIYISQFAVTSLIISQWVGQRPSSRFLFPFIFFLCITPAAAKSEQGKSQFIRHLTTLASSSGGEVYTHTQTTSHGSSQRRRLPPTEFMSERVTASWRCERFSVNVRPRGRVTIVLFVFIFIFYFFWQGWGGLGREFGGNWHVQASTLSWSK